MEEPEEIDHRGPGAAKTIADVPPDFWNYGINAITGWDNEHTYYNARPCRNEIAVKNPVIKTRNQ